MRGPDSRSRKYERDDGVVSSLQVSVNPIEPVVLGSRIINLLAKDRRRAALLDLAICADAVVRPAAERVNRRRPKLALS
jgi:hypothetical protein